VFDRLADEANGIDVLDFAASAERFAWPADRDVNVGTQAALLHVAVAGAEIAQNAAQLGHERLRLFRRTEIRLRHDLHQSNTGSVEIDQRHGRMLIVNGFAGILLQMKPLDADADFLAFGQLDHDLAFAHDGRLVLADLISLRQIGVEIILPIEHGFPVDLRFQTEAGAHRLAHAFLIDHRQHARHRGIHQRNM
jgi:hypothetical protein